MTMMNGSSRVFCFFLLGVVSTNAFVVPEQTCVRPTQPLFLVGNEQVERRLAALEKEQGYTPSAATLQNKSLDERLAALENNRNLGSLGNRPSSARNNYNGKSLGNQQQQRSSARYDQRQRDTTSSAELQGEGAIKTWSFDNPDVETIDIHLHNEGSPVEAVVDLWQGPHHTPTQAILYSEDGNQHPLHTKMMFVNQQQSHSASHTVGVRNTAPMTFPCTASVSASSNADERLWRLLQAPQEHVQGGALQTFTMDPHVDEVRILVQSSSGNTNGYYDTGNTMGRPLHARIELLQGPNNKKQVVEVYTDQGPFFVEMKTPGSGYVVRVMNISPMEFPLGAVVETYSSRQGTQRGMSYSGGYSNNGYDMDSRYRTSDRNRFQNNNRGMYSSGYGSGSYGSGRSFGSGSYGSGSYGSGRSYGSGSYGSGAFGNGGYGGGSGYGSYGRSLYSGSGGNTRYNSNYGSNQGYNYNNYNQGYGYNSNRYNNNQGYGYNSNNRYNNQGYGYSNNNRYNNNSLGYGYSNNRYNNNQGYGNNNRYGNNNYGSSYGRGGGYRSGGYGGGGFNNNQYGSNVGNRLMRTTNDIIPDNNRRWYD